MKYLILLILIAGCSSAPKLPPMPDYGICESGNYRMCPDACETFNQIPDPCCIHNEPCTMPVTEEMLQNNEHTH